MKEGKFRIKDFLVGIKELSVGIKELEVGLGITRDSWVHTTGCVGKSEKGGK